MGRLVVGFVYAVVDLVVLDGIGVFDILDIVLGDSFGFEGRDVER